MSVRELPSRSISRPVNSPGRMSQGTFFPAVQRQSQPQQQQQPQPPPQPQPKAPLVPQVFSACEPARQLTWADYKAAVPAGTTWGAVTFSGPRVVAFNKKDLFQAFFDPDQSWVQPWNKTPADNAANGCTAAIAALENIVRTDPKHIGKAGRPAQVKCAATIFPNNLEVHSVKECTSVFGPECTRVRVAESARLLAHEQVHYDISCQLVKNANALLLKGEDFDAVNHGLAALYTKLNVNNGSGQGDYDSDAKHGCDQGQQDKWKKKTAEGLVDYKIIP